MPPQRFITPRLARAAMGVLAGAALLLGACASGGDGAPATVKYPRRKPGCKIAVYHGPTPGVKEWDDIGVAEISCDLDSSRPQCLAQLQAEACRMGGDLMYDVPKKPLRPQERAMLYRARVAHTRMPELKEKPAVKAGEEPPPPATPEESAGPVIPLGAPAPPTDGGGVTDGGASD
jgi:hypothetical protein